MAHIHNIYDTDPHFKIDDVTRVVKDVSESKTTIVQFDHNSERITFELPRHIDGHDMSTCNIVQVHYLNVDGKDKTIQREGVYEVDDLQISPDSDDVVVFSWLVSGNATQLVGTLNFVCRFVCTSDAKTVDYAWNTATYTGIPISAGLYFGEAVVQEYADVLAQWETEMVKKGEVVTNLQDGSAKGSLRTINSVANGDYSFAEGSFTTASGDSSHTEGGSTTASGDKSHAEGSGTIASGSASHAEGYDTEASGYYSHAEGGSTIAKGMYQHAQGKFNIADDTLAHIVGNGHFQAGVYIRSNAHTLDWEGNAWYAGDVYIGSDGGTNKDEGSKKLATETYVDEQIAAIPEPESCLFVVNITFTTVDGTTTYTADKTYDEIKAAYDAGKVCVAKQGSTYFSLYTLSSWLLGFVNVETMHRVQFSISSANKVTRTAHPILLCSGGTMTGNLTLAGDPTNDLHAATKQYVDAVGAAITAESIGAVPGEWEEGEDYFGVAPGAVAVSNGNSSALLCGSGVEMYNENDKFGVAGFVTEDEFGIANNNSMIVLTENGPQYMDGNGERHKIYHEGYSPVFWAEYGVTTFDEINAAIENGKIVALKYFDGDETNVAYLDFYYDHTAYFKAQSGGIYSCMDDRWYIE